MSSPSCWGCLEVRSFRAFLDQTTDQQAITEKSIDHIGHLFTLDLRAVPYNRGLDNGA